MSLSQGARPPLKLEIVSEADTLSQSDAPQERTVVIDTDFVQKLMKENCSACQPHPSYFEDIDIPSRWHHIPWDEIEMRKHDLVNSRCEHLEAVQPLDELRIRTRAKTQLEEPKQPRVPTEEPENRRGKLTFVFADEPESEVTETVETDALDDSHDWEIVEEEPLLRCITETLEMTKNFTVKRLADGGRLIDVKSNTGCRLRVLEDAEGQHRLVTTRCCGKDAGMAVDVSIPSPSSAMTRDATTTTRCDENNDGVATDASIASPTSPKAEDAITTTRSDGINDGVAADASIPSPDSGSTEEATTTQSESNDDGTAIDASIPSPSAESDRVNVPPLALTSKLTHSARVDPLTFVVPPSWSTHTGEPQPFESIVAESEADQVASGRSAAIPDSVASEELPVAESSRPVPSKPSMKRQDDKIEPEPAATLKVSSVPIVDTSPENREGEDNGVRMAFKVRVRLRRKGKEGSSKKE